MEKGHTVKIRISLVVSILDNLENLPFFINENKQKRNLKVG